MVRTATPFPMVSLLFVFTAFVISNIGHIRPQRTILAFVSGIFFILSGKPHHHFFAHTSIVFLWISTRKFGRSAHHPANGLALDFMCCWCSVSVVQSDNSARLRLKSGWESRWEVCIFNEWCSRYPSMVMFLNTISIEWVYFSSQAVINKNDFWSRHQISV